MPLAVHASSIEAGFCALARFIALSARRRTSLGSR
jgi:hypothetical protein